VTTSQRRLRGSAVGAEERPAAHRPSRRGEIVAAAIQVFGAEGLAGATIADVADTAGMAPAAVYYHFSGKEELLSAAVEVIGNDVTSIAARAMADPSLEPVDQLAAAVRLVFAWADDHREEAQLFYLWAVGAAPEVERIRRSFYERHVHGARLRMVGTTIPPEAVDLAARTVVSMSIQTSVAWLSEDVFPDGTTRKAVVDGLVRTAVRLFDLDR
jgi:AcrR family transcriptional regulator